MQIWLYWQFWTDLIQSDQKINRIEMIYFNDYFIRNQIWSSLIHFGQIWSKKNQKQNSHFYSFFKCNNFFSSIFRLVRNPIWSSLIHFGQIWSKKIKNVTTFYSNIFRLVRNPLWSSLIHFGQIWSKKSKTKQPFLSLL